jgi:hypothetical protein
MNVGTNLQQALAQAYANARLTKTNRYLHQDAAGTWWLSTTPPRGPMVAGHPYKEVHPDATYEDKEAQLG